jgi:predicted GIY-YIG superfamily endonuclease
MSQKDNVYLLHFSDNLCHARHYIGATADVEKRLQAHKKNPRPKILRACRDNGIDFEVVRVWENKARGFERLLKKRKNSPELCPICNPETWDKKAVY